MYSGVGTAAGIAAEAVATMASAGNMPDGIACESVSSGWLADSVNNGVRGVASFVGAGGRTGRVTGVSLAAAGGAIVDLADSCPTSTAGIGADAFTGTSTVTGTAAFRDGFVAAGFAAGVPGLLSAGADGMGIAAPARGCAKMGSPIVGCGISGAG